MPVTSYENYICSLVSLDIPQYRIVLEHKKGVMLGRADTLDPHDECIPGVCFIVKANVIKKYINVFVVAANATLNGYQMEEDAYYKIEHDDILGFCPGPRHQYRVSIPTMH